MVGYQARGPKPELQCDQCVQWQAGPVATCAKCRVMPGPVDSVGYCRLFLKRG
jgi:hypothetical protein